MDNVMFFNILLALSIGANIVLSYLTWQYDKTLDSAHTLILHLLNDKMEVVVAKEASDESN